MLTYGATGTPMAGAIGHKAHPHSLAHGPQQLISGRRSPGLDALHRLLVDALPHRALTKRGRSGGRHWCARRARARRLAHLAHLGASRGGDARAVQKSDLSRARSASFRVQYGRRAAIEREGAWLWDPPATLLRTLHSSATSISRGEAALEPSLPCVFFDLVLVLSA